MRVPRDLSGADLVKRLGRFGYNVTRQTGSHLRLTSTTHGEHHITIPAHKNIKIGTLNNILVDVAGHFKISKEELIKKLW